MNLITLLLVGLIELQIIVAILFAMKKMGHLRSTARKATFVDTSALMDGRIALAASTGFFPSSVVIPKSVLAELQLLADGSDSDKRARARHGLDIAKALRDNPRINVTILNDKAGSTGVDDQLLKLAKQYNGSICTIDFNLNKVAQAEGIAVLNINELAQQIRANYLPGEKVSIAIIQKGSESHQGVGYLADGTMAVIDEAKSDIGKTVSVEITRSIQTAAGRMLFGKKIAQQTEKKKPQVRKKQTRPKSAEDSLVELANR